VGGARKRKLFLGTYKLYQGITKLCRFGNLSGSERERVYVLTMQVH
jgi:hypothetical protein